MDNAIGGSCPITIRSAFVVLSVSVLYLLLSVFLVGFKTDELVLIAVFNCFFFLSPVTRKFITGFSIFILFWIIFDFMKAFPNYNYNTVHIGDVYNLEKNIFGIDVNGEMLTPNEYWRLHGNTFLDVISGIFYLCWVPVPIGFAVFLFFKNRQQFLYFSMTFFLVNIIGFVIYYLYPAAPPWYVEYHGFHFVASTPGNTAGLVKFDNYFHAGVFKSIYAKSSNVFAAMPSLHSSYPVIVVYYSLSNRLALISAFCVIVMLGIWFTAVYASHHYILDVLAGILCALLAIVLFRFMILRLGFFRLFTGRFQHYIQ
jgi:membrane-associated phospholipid phosphatase